jgi:tripartite-type tricarboxylate transporter receptor subunit TctC
MAVLPSVPTLAETFPGFEQVSWFGILVPRGTPPQVSARIHVEMKRTLEVPEVRKVLSDRGFDVVASGPEEFTRYVQNESDKLGKLIRENSIKPE